MIDKIIDGRTDLVFDFLKLGNPPDSCDKNGISLLKWCAYYGDLTAIKLLVEHGAKLENLSPNYDLNGAVFHGHWQLVQYILEQGADPNYRSIPSGETPLHNAIKANHPVSNHLIKILLHFGADPNIKTNPGKETGSFMRDVYTKAETPLHRAAAFGNEESIRLLVSAGADKSVKDINGESPIGWASWHGRPGSILTLLSHGEHRIHFSQEQSMLKDHGYGWSGGMEINLLGTPHLP